MRNINESLPTLPVGLFQADPVGRVTTTNPAFGALVLGGPGVAVGSPPWVNAHPGDRAGAELQWRRCIDAGEPINVEFRVWHAEGRMVWVRIDAMPMHDATGRLTGYGGSALDTTNAVDERLMLARLLGVVEASSDSVIILDRNGAPVYANAAARVLFGADESVDLIRDPAVRALLQVVRDQVPRELIQSSETC